MAIAIPSTGTTDYPFGFAESNGEKVFFLGDPAPPTTPEEIALLQRLIARSADPNGFDRDALLRAKDAWGTTGE